MTNFLITSLTVVMCVLGIVQSIYLLVTSKVDTKLPTSNMLLCFFGLGWTSFLMQTLEYVSLGYFFGITLFFCGFFIWTYKHLRIMDSISRSIFKK